MPPTGLLAVLGLVALFMCLLFKGWARAISDGPPPKGSRGPNPL